MVIFLELLKTGQEILWGPSNHTTAGPCRTIYSTYEADPVQHSQQFGMAAVAKCREENKV